MKKMGSMVKTLAKDLEKKEMILNGEKSKMINFNKGRKI